MFLRVTNSGQDGRYHYVQLVESTRVKGTSSVKTTVIHNFGLRENLDVKGIERLIASLSSVLPETSALAGKGSPGLEFLGSREIGPCWVLDGLWRSLGIGKAVGSLVRERQFRTPMERMLFAMAANRAIAPGSKLAIERWIAKDVLVEGLPAVDVHRLYAAMDLLVEGNEPVQRAVFSELSRALSLDVDLLLLDTTSTYCHHRPYIS